MSREFKTKQFPARELLKMFSDTTSISSIADAVGADFHTVYKWKHHHININQWYADKYAIRLGLHPSAIWDDWFALETI